MTPSKLTEQPHHKPPTGRRDPVLQELWEVKARINAQAHYSVAEIVKRLATQQAVARH